MEHDVLKIWANEHNVAMNAHAERKLSEFARMIFTTNQQYNLTGLKTLHDIIETLIIGSLEPFITMNVPRGTVFADIGTGAGIPGIPLALYCNAWKGILIDSNKKKLSFVRSAIKECGLDNCEAVSGRVEDLARGELRAACDFVFSRALGEMYYAVEMAAPLMKAGGLLYVYSHSGPEEVPVPVVEHAREMGLSIVGRSGFEKYGLREIGVAFTKTGSTGSRYPRSISIIKREMKTCNSGGTAG